MKWYEAAFAGHYPVLYRHRDEAEAVRCVRHLPRLAPLGPGPLLDLGCGEGRHLVHLRRLAPVVVGLDLSATLLAGAQDRLRRAEEGEPAEGVGGEAAAAAPLLVRGDMRWLPFPAERLTAVLSLFTAFGYFGDLEAHTDLVGEIARVLAPGGHWFLDYLNCDSVLIDLKKDTNLVREGERGPFLIREERLAFTDGPPPGSQDRPDRPQVVRKRVAIRPRPGHENEAAILGVTAAGLSYMEQVALFSLEEIDALVARHGLHRVAAAGDYDAAPLTAASPRWLLVYRR